MLLVSMLLAAPLVAQSTQRVKQETRFTKAPNGTVLGAFLSGAQVNVGRSRGDAVEVALEGWIPAQSLGASARDGFNAVVSRASERLRDAPNGSPIARLGAGVLVKKSEVREGWARVERAVWIPRRALADADPPQGTRSGPARDTRGGASLSHQTPVLATAGGAQLGTIDSGAPVRVLAEAGEWTRVELQGWVKSSEVNPSSDGVLIGVTQAEVRADPARYVGQTVEWKVQFIAVQKADELRPEIPNGNSYLLTRGPLPEPGFVYVIVPQDRLEQFRSVPSLQELVLRVRIKAATAKYLPNPVVELEDVVSGMRVAQ